MLEIRRIHDELHCCLELTGDLDISTVENLLAGVETIPETAKDVDLDFSGIEFVDSTGIGTLVQVLNYLRGKEITIKFKRIPKDVFEILHLLGVTEIMGEEYFECLDE